MIVLFLKERISGYMFLYVYFRIFSFIWIEFYLNRIFSFICLFEVLVELSNLEREFGIDVLKKREVKGI